MANYSFKPAQLPFPVGFIHKCWLGPPVLTSMLTLMQIPEGGRRILFGLIILAVTALFIRLTDRS